jgi:hypothetical protein
MSAVEVKAMPSEIKSEPLGAKIAPIETLGLYVVSPTSIYENIAKLRDDIKTNPDFDYAKRLAWIMTGELGPRGASSLWKALTIRYAMLGQDVVPTTGDPVNVNKFYLFCCTYLEASFVPQKEEKKEEKK